MPIGEYWPATPLAVPPVTAWHPWPLRLFDETLTAGETCAYCAAGTIYQPAGNVPRKCDRCGAIPGSKPAIDMEPAA